LAAGAFALDHEFPALIRVGRGQRISVVCALAIASGRLACRREYATVDGSGGPFPHGEDFYYAGFSILIATGCALLHRFRGGFALRFAVLFLLLETSPARARGAPLSFRDGNVNSTMHCRGRSMGDPERVNSSHLYCDACG
jgi:hypothetical protein